MSVKYGITNITIVALMELEMMVASNPGTAKQKDKNDENSHFIREHKLSDNLYYSNNLHFNGHLHPNSAKYISSIMTSIEVQKVLCTWLLSVIDKSIPVI